MKDRLEGAMGYVSRGTPCAHCHELTDRQRGYCELCDTLKSKLRYAHEKSYITEDHRKKVWNETKGSDRKTRKALEKIMKLIEKKQWEAERSRIWRSYNIPGFRVWRKKK